jgi:hypothetical protein
VRAVSIRPTQALGRFLAMALACAIVGTVAITFLGVPGSGRQIEHFPQPFLDMWVRWDAGWYEQIALREYTYSPTQQSAAAYFPLYPLAMRAVMLTGTNVFITGILLTFLFGAAAVVMFSRWASAMKPDAANLATWLLVLWPFAFYIVGAVYSDALFLLCVTTAFFQLEKGRVGWATFFGALATATRPIAPAVVLGLLVRHLEMRRAAGHPIRVRDFVPLGAAAGLAAFMGFLWWKFGDPIGFVTTQAGWQQLSGPAAVFKYGALEKMKRIDLIFPLFHALLAFAALASAWPMRKSLGWGYAVYTAVAVGLPLISSRDFIGLGRYVIAVFPFFLQAALILGEKPKRKIAWLAFSSIMLIWMTSRFAMGFYTS